MNRVKALNRALWTANLLLAALFVLQIVQIVGSFHTPPDLPGYEPYVDEGQPAPIPPRPEEVALRDLPNPIGGT